MKYYCVAEFDVTDRDWVPEYVREATGLVERYGGRYPAREVAKNEAKVAFEATQEVGCVRHLIYSLSVDK